MENAKRGAAEIRVKLENSTIEIYHFDGSLLHTRPAVAGDWCRIWRVLKPAAAEISPTQLDAFLEQPGINITGICEEAGITKQYLNRCRKDKTLPGEKVLNKLLPILIKYGF